MSDSPARKKKLLSPVSSYQCQSTLTECWRNKETSTQKLSANTEVKPSKFFDEIDYSELPLDVVSVEGDSSGAIAMASSISSTTGGLEIAASSSCEVISRKRSKDQDSEIESAVFQDFSFGPSTGPILPPLRSSIDHAVLIFVPLRFGVLPRPYPVKFRDVWDSNHVKMPCSDKNVYPVSSGSGRILSSRWSLICQSLKSPICNSHELENAIMRYNSSYLGKWNFDGLHTYFTEKSVKECSMFFGTVLPALISLVLQLPLLVTHAIPLLKKQENYSITMSQQQVACLLANAFLCTFPRRNVIGGTSEYSSYPSINFSNLYSSDAPGKSITSKRSNKLTCIIHYFKRIIETTPNGVITFQRRVLHVPPNWEKSTMHFTNLVVDYQGTIETNGHGMLQVDFANKCVGGGVLRGGLVQEEIRFLICPELILSRLFTEELDDNEVLEVVGSEVYSTYTGYASSFAWSGNYQDDIFRDSWGRRQRTVVAMDALQFNRSKSSQFKAGMLRRELNKAYCGFMASRDHSIPSGKDMAVATGNWGCGAFGGDPRLKCLLQLMAAAQARRDVVYFTFGNEPLKNDICKFYSFLRMGSYTVGDIWKILLKCGPQEDIFMYLKQELDKS